MNAPMSDFERGRRIVKILVILAVVFAVVALMFTQTDSRESVILVLAAFACVIGVIVAAARFCRCPHCGKRIINGVLVLKVCPKCKRSLLTGAKIKKNR